MLINSINPFTSWRNADDKFLPVFTKIILTATVRFYGIVTEKDVNTYDPSKAKTTIETSEAIDSLEIP